jgi:hypothetical protein
LDNFEKKVVLDFSRPLSKDSFSCSLRLSSFLSEENILLKKLIFQYFNKNDLGFENGFNFRRVNIENKKATSE